MTAKANLGVRPVDALGRGAEMSEVVLAEIKALKTYAEELRAAAPINSPEKAKLHRQATLRYFYAHAYANALPSGEAAAKAKGEARAKKLKSLFDSLGYDY